MLDMSMIMKNAWEIKRKENKNMSESLKKAWSTVKREIKKAVVDFKEMSTEALKEMLENLKAELETREEKTEEKTEEKENIIYCTDDHDLQSNRHFGKFNHWAKILKSIDVSKTNGYAFIGDFIPYKQENLVKKGSIVLEHDENGFTAYRAINDNEKEMLMNATRTNLVTFIKELKKIMG